MAMINELKKEIIQLKTKIEILKHIFIMQGDEVEDEDEKRLSFLYIQQLKSALETLEIKYEYIITKMIEKNQEKKSSEQETEELLTRLLNELVGA